MIRQKTRFCNAFVECWAHHPEVQCEVSIYAFHDLESSSDNAICLVCFKQGMYPENKVERFEKSST